MKQNSYQTRRLLATRDMRHDGQNVVAGAEVFATETDATYLIRAGHARDVSEPTRNLANAAAPAQTPMRRGPGRPPKSEAASRSPAPAASPAPPAPPAATTSADFLQGSNVGASAGAGASADDDAPDELDDRSAA